MRYALIGSVGAGKSTLFNALRGLTAEAVKTQAVDYDISGGVDTPGEFLCSPQLQGALLSVTLDADALIYVHAADDPEYRLPAGLLDVYAWSRVICVISKADLPGVDTAATEVMLREHGLRGPFFVVGRGLPAGLRRLQDWLATGGAAENA